MDVEAGSTSDIQHARWHARPSCHQIWRRRDTLTTTHTNRTTRSDGRTSNHPLRACVAPGTCAGTKPHIIITHRLFVSRRRGMVHSICVQQETTEIDKMKRQRPQHSTSLPWCSISSLLVALLPKIWSFGSFWW